MNNETWIFCLFIKMYANYIQYLQVGFSTWSINTLLLKHTHPHPPFFFSSIKNSFIF